MPDTVQVNVSMDAETAHDLDTLAREDGIDNRSAMVRRLIRQEIARRYSTPQPCITVAEALAHTL